jgi:hypothetical protein
MSENTPGTLSLSLGDEIEIVAQRESFRLGIEQLGITVCFTVQPEAVVKDGKIHVTVALDESSIQVVDDLGIGEA